MKNTKHRYSRIAAALVVVLLSIVVLVIPASAAVPVREGGTIVPDPDNPHKLLCYYENGDLVTDNGDERVSFEWDGVTLSYDLSYDFSEDSYLSECGEGYRAEIVADGLGFDHDAKSNTLVYVVGVGFEAPTEEETSATVVEPDPDELGESTDSTDRDDDALDDSSHMSLYRISRAFINFFLEGADEAIIDWFACCLALGLAGGVLGIFVYPCSLIWKKVKK